MRDRVLDNLRIVFSFAFLLVLGPAAACQDNEKQVRKDRAPRGRVIYNLDSDEFFVGTFGKPVPQTIDTLVKAHADLRITDLFLNANAQRTNYRSAVWESAWDGYDPSAGDDQPFFAGIDPKRRFEAQTCKNVLALHKQGCDLPKRMIDRARRAGLKAWISVRMNDSHYPDQPGHPYHSTFWRSHPQWHLANKSLDYEQPEVRDHYLKLVRETCARYDLEGLELDFLRHPSYFRPGREHAGVKLMTALVEQARSATRKAAKRLGRPVGLAVRVPTTPWIARRHGLDAIAWAKAGLVDLITVSPYWSSSSSDVPIETWKGLLRGTEVAVALCLEDGIDSGASGRRTMTHEEMRGILVSGLHRGADAVYFFNLFGGPYQRWPRAHHDQLLKDAGSYAALCAGPRRHVLTMTVPWTAGEPGDPQPLPYIGKQGAFRLHIGPKPLPRQQARIELVTPGSARPPDLHLNGIPCPWSRLAEAEHIKASGWKGPEQGRRHVYDVPPDALSDGYNLIEVRTKQDVKTTWVEIAVR